MYHILDCMIEVSGCNYQSHNKVYFIQNRITHFMYYLFKSRRSIIDQILGNVLFLANY